MRTGLDPNKDGTETEGDVHGDQKEPNEPFCIAVGEAELREAEQGDAERCLAQRSRHNGQCPRDISVELQCGQYGLVEVVHMFSLAERDIDGD